MSGINLRTIELKAARVDAGRGGQPGSDASAMRMRVVIARENRNTVSLTEVDGTITRFFVPYASDGRQRYVCIRDDAQRYPQVCEGLYSMGSTLMASEDTLLAVIRPTAPQATWVSVRGCPALVALDVPQATTVYASRCTALVTLHAPQATTVYASRCPALVTLVAPQATTVDVEGCTALTKAQP
jgi:hypothetical protein